MQFDKIRNGDKKEFDRVYQKYYPILVQFAQGFLVDRMACEEVVQNLFIHLWENRQTIKIHSSLEPYLLVSTKNRCLNKIKKLQIEDAHNALYVQSLIDVAVTDPYEETAQVKERLLSELEDAISSLPTQVKTIIELKYLKSKKLKEISELLKITENSVKTQIKRGKTKLRNILDED